MMVCDLARMLIMGSVVVAAVRCADHGPTIRGRVADWSCDCVLRRRVPELRPGLVDRDQLHDGNGKLGATQAFAQVAGPGLGGVLFGLLRASAMAVDAFSY